MKCKDKGSQITGDLRSVSFEIRGFAYLLQNQKSDEVPPLDLEDLHYGIGQILDRLGRRVRRLSNKLESTDDL